MQRGDIAIVNLTVINSRNKKYFLSDVIFSIPYDSDRQILKYNNIEDRRIIRKFNLSEDLTIVNIDVIKPLGKKSVGNLFYK
jgi:hypothetical protein